MRAGLLLLGLLPGCTLVDQTTFRAGAGAAPEIARPAAAVPAPVRPGPPALLVLRMDQAGNWQAAVQQGVRAARARKPGVVFDVVQSVPLGTDPAAVRAADAIAVARAIEDAGVPANRVLLAARPEAGGDPREVRVYVR